MMILFRKIKETDHLNDENSADIICMHDDREDILDTFMFSGLLA